MLYLYPNSYYAVFCLDLLALFVKKPKLDTLGAVLDKIEKLWLRIHLVGSHKIIIADAGFGA